MAAGGGPAPGRVKVDLLKSAFDDLSANIALSPVSLLRPRNDHKRHRLMMATR